MRQGGTERRGLGTGLRRRAVWVVLALVVGCTLAVLGGALAQDKPATPAAAKTLWVSSLSCATTITFGGGRRTDAGSSLLLAESTSASLEGWG